MLAGYDEKKDQLNQNWAEMYGQVGNVAWTPEDRVHVVDQLNNDMDMGMLKNVMKAKIQEMFYLFDNPAFNDDLKCKVAQCIIFTSMALRVNEMFEYSDNFSSQQVFGKFETMKLDQLRKVAESYK